MTTKLRVNLMGDDDFRDDILQLVREQVKVVLRSSQGEELMREVVEKVVIDYIGSHDLESLIPAALVRAFPAAANQMAAGAVGAYLTELMMTSVYRSMSPEQQKVRDTVREAIAGMVRVEVSKLAEGQLKDLINRVLAAGTMKIT